MLFQRIIGSVSLRCNSSFLSRKCISTSPTVFTLRTEESNPSNHTSGDVASFYTVPNKVRQKLFAFGGLPKSFVTNANTFDETCVMVRSPAVEIIDFLRNTDFDRPVVRYLLYGKPGCGKSMSLAHVLHYAYVNDFIIIHVPWTWDWFRRNRNEAFNSTTRPGLIDMPVISANWLKHFQSQNEELLKNLNLTTEKEYVWNPRETTAAGSPISDLIAHGINRVKYAADAVDALVSEIKSACSSKKCKALVAIDGFNALFGASPTVVKTEDKKMVNPNKVSLSRTFLDACKQDWTNGAVVLVADQRAAKHELLKNHYPLYLIGRKGFELIDPFIPISVTEFTDAEFNCMMDYYADRKWYMRKEGRVDLAFLSNKNPYKLMTLCGGL